MSRWKRPERIILPGGFRITVTVLNKKEASELEGSKADYVYDKVGCEVRLRASRRKHWKEDLRHEIMHAVVDWIDEYMQMP